MDTTNPDSLHYENSDLELTVLGGVRLEGLDRMRVTVKVQLTDSPRPPVRHNLDLYNDNQLEKFVRKLAERLEIGTAIIAASLSELTEELEKYRLQKIREQEEQLRPKAKKLNLAEIDEAESFLKQKDLLKRTNELIGQSGVIGEETNRLLMYIILTSRMREQPLHVISLGSSGTGKTHLQTAVGVLVPEEERVSITTLSENAFYYFGKQELKHKAILIEDLDGAENALYPLRELQTKKRIVKTIASKNHKGETQTKYLVVEGPVCVAGCTTKEHIYEDNANRSFLIHLDESDAQNQKIMEYQRAVSAGHIDFHKQREIQTLLQNTQRILQPIKVINPFADQLQLPKSVFKPRRTNNHYLQFIEAVTFYHQYQRKQKTDKQTGEIFIETTLEDIENANELLKDILLRKSDEISGSCRNYLEEVKSYLKQTDKKAFGSLEIRRALRIAKTSQWRFHKQLLESQLIKKIKIKGTQAFNYQITSDREYRQMRDQIDTVLQGCLDEIRKGKKK